MNRFYGVFSKMTILLGVSSFSFCAYIAFSIVERAGLKRAVESVCSRIEEEYVRNDDAKVKSFVQTCFEESNRDVDRALSGDYGSDSRRALIDILNERLSLLRVSHMLVFAPDQTAALWTNESFDTGARARLVDGEVVITRTVESSPAARAGILRGDIVVAVDGVPLGDASEAQSLSGVWEVLRPDNTRVSVPIEAEIVQDHVTPYWAKDQESPGIRVLRVPSFLPQAMDGDEWPKVRDQIGRLQSRGERLIVDVRGNPGGSFPAMLRLLGVLKCDRSLVGWIYRGTPPTTESAVEFQSLEMQDSLDAGPQLDLLKRNGSIALAPFESDSCYGGPVGVLIDQGTGSVAEIFAQAMKERPRTTIAGWRSSGHVVMARWFQIAGLSQDYTVSVPVALYRSAKGEELEGRGVSPDQLLTDKLERWRSRQDPWIKDVSRAVSQ